MAPKDLGWVIMGMYLFLMGVTTLNIRMCIAMRDAQGMVVPGWLASQTDMLAEDWDLVE